MFICLNESFELLLEAVVLVVEVGHVLVKSINLSLQLYLILVHLLRVMLESVDLIPDTLFVLFKLSDMHSQLIALKLSVLALNIFILIGLEKLPLSVFALLNLQLEVAKLLIQLVQVVFHFLNYLVTFANLLDFLRKLFIFVVGHLLLSVNSLIVVGLFVCQNLNPGMLRVELFVMVQLLFSQSQKLIIVVMTDSFLLAHQSFLILNFFPLVEIFGILDVADLPLV